MNLIYLEILGTMYVKDFVREVDNQVPCLKEILKRKKIRLKTQ